MQRITISLEESLAQQFDDLISQHGYLNRSEAFRDLLRARIEADRKTKYKVMYCVATVSYIYNHAERQLAHKIVGMQHEHHDICISTMQVHLDHDNCLETLVLKGPFKLVSTFANQLIALSGVRHGNINTVPVEIETNSHAHHEHGHPVSVLPHIHLQPKT